MKGLKIAVALICIGLSISTLSGLGWFGEVGVHPDGSVETGETVDEVGDIDIESDGGLLGDFAIVRAVMDGVNALRMMTTQTESMLLNLGAPQPIAESIETIVIVTISIGLLFLIRGIRSG